MASRLLLSPGQDLAAAQITPIWAELISIWTCQFPRISAGVCRSSKSKADHAA
jgi:hypothetical protein